MANDITARQNESHSLQLLAAQQKLYGRAKYAAALQVILVVILPAALLVIENIAPPLKLIAASVALGMAVLDVALLDRWKSSFQQRAAAIQELFDCRVLNLQWPGLKARRPDREDIEGLATGVDVGPLRDWYPPAIDGLPLHAGRVVCQRSNCRWDSKLRRQFRTLVIAFAVVVLLIAIVVAIVRNLRFEEFILFWMAPILPIALWGFREGYSQNEAADRADRLKEFSDDLWERTVNQAEPVDAIAASSRRFQDELFEHRQRSPVVFDWFYRMFRSRFESQMHHPADAMLEEAKARGLIEP
jgi:hypothetical protein